MTIFGMKRPLNTAAHKSSKRSQVYPVIIEHLTILNLDENNDKKFINNCQIGVLSLIKQLEESKKEEYDEICKRDEFSHNLENIRKVADFLKKEAEKEKKEQKKGKRRKREQSCGGRRRRYDYVS